MKGILPKRYLSELEARFNSMKFIEVLSEISLS